MIGNRRVHALAIGFFQLDVVLRIERCQGRNRL
jgi:hypothetical protein